MYPVDYEHRFDYRRDPRDGNPRPILSFDLVNREAPECRVQASGLLDTGCERSIFEGHLALMLGIDLLEAPRVPYCTAIGHRVEVPIHPVRLEHPLLGSFDLEVGFAQFPLSRNLLGRDFLDHVQIGFREHRLEFYVTARP